MSPSSSRMPTPSPLLANSSFASFDYFNAPTVTLSLAPSTPTSTSPARSRASTPVLLPSFREMSPRACRDLAEEIELSSPPAPQAQTPVILVSPTAANRRQAAARRSVQIQEKSAVNWARPLRKDAEFGNAVLIFGASLQRNRRLDRKSPGSHLTPAPSPASSSDEEPVTPCLTPTSVPSVALNWSTSRGSGLGMPGVAEWDSSPVCESPALSLKDYYLSRSSSSSSRPHSEPKTAGDRYSYVSDDSSAGSSSSANLSPSSLATEAQTPSPAAALPSVRLLTSSQSLNSFSSPTNLAELKYLRQAACELESEARRLVSSPSQPDLSASAGSSTPRERKIRRKAVPRLDPIMQNASLSSSTSVLTDSVSHPSSPTTPAGPSTDRRLQFQFLEKYDTRPPLPSSRQSPQPRAGQFYQNRMATMSVIEVSPRVASLPVVIPSRGPSSMGMGMGSPTGKASGRGGADKEKEKEFLAKLAKLDEGLEKLRVEKEKKHRRGLSRFLTRRAVDI